MVFFNILKRCTLSFKLTELLCLFGVIGFGKIAWMGTYEVFEGIVVYVEMLEGCLFGWAICFHYLVKSVNSFTNCLLSFYMLLLRFLWRNWQWPWSEGRTKHGTPTFLMLSVLLIPLLWLYIAIIRVFFIGVDYIIWKMIMKFSLSLESTHTGNELVSDILVLGSKVLKDIIYFSNLLWYDHLLILNLAVRLYI